MITRRRATTAVLAAWAALFWWLLLGERSSLYLSTRTDWLVPVGAVLLTGAALGRLAPGASAGRPASPREIWGLVVLVVPVIAVAAVPSASLGSFAVDRRSAFSTANFSTSLEDLAEGELTLVDLAGAQQSQEGMSALVARAGTEVDFTGFVVRDGGMQSDEFKLTRFIVACCVADALSVQVRVIGVVPGRWAEDDWVRVTGRLYPIGGDVVVQADSVAGVERPEVPYITP